MEASQVLPPPLFQSLAGQWQLSRESDTAVAAVLGRPERGWTEHVQLPGSLAVQGMGDPVALATSWTGTIFNRAFFDSPDCAHLRAPGNLRMPFWLQPRTVFTGEAWYRREIEIPETWRGRRIIFFLERPHWRTRVWLDDREIGTGESLSTPHEFELGLGLAPGRYGLTLCVDNRVHVGIGDNAHSISDHTQGNWNGVIGRVELQATDPVWISDVQVHARAADASILVKGTVGGTTMPVRVTLAIPECRPEPLVVETTADGRFSERISLGAEAACWDEFSPTLHTLTVSLDNGGSREVRFGLRDLEARGRQLFINGRPLFLRGTLDCCAFPRTGHPPMDAATWRRILGTIKDHGFNHVRFHSWCPPEAAFVAGDELGVYFQIEAATWPNSSAVLAFNAPSGIGDGEAVDAWTLAEAERIVRAYGNHPCFLLMAAGNEPGGPDHRAYLHRWVTHLRESDPRRLYTGASGWPEIPENQFHVIPEPRLHQWGDGLKSRLNAVPPDTNADYRASVARRTAPVIAHETGQWCAYPPIYDTAKYNGHLEPRNYGVFAESLAARGLAGRARDFVQASGRLQALCYKEEIEAALRTPGLGGFQLLGLQDFPGQGTAPVGILDAFGDPKGYVAAGAFRRFCGPVVPLARLAMRVFTTAETLTAGFELANFGPAPLQGAVAVWRLVGDRGAVLSAGRQRPADVPVGNGHTLGRIGISLREVPAPCRCRLELVIEGTPFANDWEVWVYPEQPPAAPSGVRVTSSSAVALDALAQGGRVLLLVPPERVRGGVALGFTPIFWNTWCTHGQAPHTLGILCDPADPALAHFPTDAHSNWQWWHLVCRAGAMVLDDLPGVEPVVRVIDDWYTNHNLGLVLEAMVAGGRLIVCSIDLEAVHDPVVAQFRHSLLQRLADPSSNEPKLVLTPAQIRHLSGDA